MVYTVGMFYPRVVRMEASQILTVGSRYELAADFFTYQGTPGY